MDALLHAITEAPRLRRRRLMASALVLLLAPLIFFDKDVLARSGALEAKGEFVRAHSVTSLKMSAQFMQFASLSQPTSSASSVSASPAT